MSDKNIERKITVIFATDVVSYSKHMETNENGTLQSLRECSGILQEIIKKFDFKSWWVVFFR